MKLTELCHHKWTWISGAVLCCTALIMTIAGLLASPIPKTYQIQKIPLSNNRIASWAQTSESLAREAARNRFDIPGDTFLELIEWGRRNPQKLDCFLKTATVEEFLGVAISVEHARRNHKKVEEHLLQLEKMGACFFDVTEQTNWPPIPEESCALEPWEEADLAAYERNEQVVDNTLDKLVPDRPPLVPALAQPALSIFEAESESEPVDRQSGSWRVVSRSRYGPRILRSR